MISSKTHNNQQQQQVAASAYGGKTARACDSCIRKRARWYCAADDAFLCQSCDSSVHSANPLARRHERVRLKTASLKSLSLTNTTASSPLHQQPTWHRGFTRKARTPRPNGANKTTSSSAPSLSKSSNNIEATLMMRVPEVGSDEAGEEEEEEHQLLYRVPIFDPLESFHHHHHQTAVSASSSGGGGDDDKSNHHHHHHQESLLQMQGLVLPSDMDLDEFAADVESLLGRGLENESFGMEELGILDCSHTNNNDNNNNRDDDDVSKLVKMEIAGEFVDENLGRRHHHHHDGGGEVVVVECGGVLDGGSDEPPFQLSFEYGDGDEEDSGGVDTANNNNGTDEVGDNMDVGSRKKRKLVRNNNNNNILLRLDYEAVMAAWDTSTRGSTSPWTNGRRPDFDLNECWPDCMGGCGREQVHQLGYQLGEGRSSLGGGHPGAGAGDGGREARVSRYREKRRTRLFSKKIRYEVRKLNAEKRPRMKGRFVKRASFAATSTTTSLPYTSLVRT